MQYPHLNNFLSDKKVASTKFASKVLPACSMLLLTLATRACLAVGGLSTHPASPIHLNSSNMTSLDGKEELWSNLNGLAILNPLAPHWQMLTEPGLWLEATIQVRA